jgi:hypothetical protein
MKNKENMNNHKHEPYRLLWILIACSAAFWAFGWIATHFGCVSADIQTGIVLTFVGILATFVVVSNYMQVKDVDDRLKCIEEQIKILNAVSEQFSKSNTEVGNIISELTTNIPNEELKEDNQ